MHMCGCALANALPSAIQEKAFSPELNGGETLQEDAFPSAAQNADVLSLTTINISHLSGGETKAKDDRGERSEEPGSVPTWFSHL